MPSTVFLETNVRFKLCLTCLPFAEHIYLVLDFGIFLSLFSGFLHGIRNMSENDQTWCRFLLTTSSNLQSPESELSSVSISSTRSSFSCSEFLVVNQFLHLCNEENLFCVGETSFLVNWALPTASDLLFFCGVFDFWLSISVICLCTVLMLLLYEESR